MLSRTIAWRRCLSHRLVRAFSSEVEQTPVESEEPLQQVPEKLRSGLNPNYQAFKSRYGVLKMTVFPNKLLEMDTESFEDQIT